MVTENNPSEPDVLVISAWREGNRAVVELGGELDLHGSDRLTAEVKRLLNDDSNEPERIERVEVDARRLTFADSAGLRAVLLARTEAQTTGATFMVVAVSAPVERVIEMAGLTDVLLPAGPEAD
jgi:anti-sigma B factor antagonist